MRQIAFVIFPGVTQLDLTGPVQVLSRLPGSTTHIVARSVDPVTTDCGFGIVPTTNYDACPPPDLVVVPGGFGVDDALADGKTVPFLRRAAKSAQYLTSVCTGAFLLGAAGLLQGRRATTHWAYHAALEKVGAIRASARVVKDGPIITGGGVTAGIDFAFHVAAEVAGREVAERIQLALEYDPDPPFRAGHPNCAPADVLSPVAQWYEDRRRVFVARLDEALANLDV